MTEPAAIRYNNPGAQWDGAIAKRWGSTQHVVLADGQANHIAIFPTKVQGACAEFDLWRSRYTGLTLNSAIAKWSGGNSPAAYMTFLEVQSGILRTEMVTPALLASERGIKLMKAQAHWEAAKPYPMSDAEWRRAQSAVFAGGSKPSSSGKVAGSVIAGTVATAAAGYNFGAVIGVAAVAILIAVVVWIILRANRNDVPQPLPIPDPTPRPIPSRGLIPKTLPQA